jgi:hypothetical protein
VAAEPRRIALGGVWYRHVRGGGNPLRLPADEARGRWQRGRVIAALRMPRDLWRYEVPLTDVADLTDRDAQTPPGPGPPAPSDAVLPSFVSVAARGFSLALSRPLVGASGVRSECATSVRTPYKLVVSPDGTHTWPESFSTLDPGLYGRRTVSLSPGRYQLSCSLESHEALGMSVTLRVQ